MDTIEFWLIPWWKIDTVGELQLAMMIGTFLITIIIYFIIIMYIRISERGKKEYDKKGNNGI